MHLNKSIPIILIIDDIPIQHEKIKKSFPQYIFDSAFSIKDAQKKVRWNKYDLILLDLELNSIEEKSIHPINLNGIDLIPDMWGNAPIIVISSHDKSTIVSKTIRTGAIEFLSKKEFDLVEWKSKFDEIISKKTIRIFFLSSKKDQFYLKKLEQHFVPLKKRESIVTWHMGELMGGDFTNDKIDEELDKSHIVLLLLTSDFLSDPLTQKLLDRCFKRVDNIRLVPILFSPCLWELNKLKELKPLPQNEVFITEWNNEDAAFRDVIYSLSLIINKIKKKLFLSK